MPLLPLKDDNTLKIVPWQVATGTFMVVCVVVFLYQLGLSGDDTELFHLRYGFIPVLTYGSPPAEYGEFLTALPEAARLVTATFLHADLWHLGGNLLYLWIFGDNVEDAMGHGRFVAFFLLCGAAGAAAQGLATPDSLVIGASGAISGVLGAYMLLHPKVRVLSLVGAGKFRIPLRLPAYMTLGGWIGFQVVSAWIDTEGGVAWWAHIGGFAAGVVLVVPMRRRGVPLLDGVLRPKA